MTVGYQDRTLDDLINVLAAANVGVLVDVRLTPLSRKPGMSKRRLAARLRDEGIHYLHLPQLGNPRDNRDAFRRNDAHARGRYSGVLQSAPGRDALQQLADLVPAQRLALMCFERNASECHRSMAAEALAAMDRALEVRHL